MTQEMMKRMSIFALVSIFIFVLGTSCFAAKPVEDSVNWSYLSSCSYDFHKGSGYSVYCSGTTTVSSSLYAYVKVELQKYTDLFRRRLCDTHGTLY